MGHHINKVRIKAVATALDTLKEKVVFVGGATISLYPDQPVFEVRPTDDVDVIIEILNYSDRSELEEKLRSIGFAHDIESGVICRYRIQGIVVDIMPTNDSSIGFTNIWYPEGYKNAVNYKIDERCIVKILSAPYFIATKLEAYKNRGKDDGRTSKDFEDIIYVLENREVIWDEINNSTENLKNYLLTEFRNLLKNPNLFEWIDCHVERGSPPASYFIMEEIEKFTA
ncbi:MAG TPA: nucleotidyl transferase AbiEii/AbiGii toxin family protein [Chitinophagales bacterium]|nr:nucleotidyl transferase AbiEii/AbiGii toxin family protein [Chitinophagales bacterium]HRG87073.1 nucleotidyl transferase AbiEii/AbiGii toxin family protein [Chitinophagales bacterium]